jgi:hypothetical protein
VFKNQLALEFSLRKKEDAVLLSADSTVKVASCQVEVAIAPSVQAIVGW